MSKRIGQFLESENKWIKLADEEIKTSCIFEAISSDVIYAETLKHLEPQELAQFQAASLKCETLAKEKVKEFATKLGLVKSANELDGKNYFKITQKYIEQLIKKAKKIKKCPAEIAEISQRIKNGVHFALVDDIKRLEAAIKARDTLMVWEKLVIQANAARADRIHRGISVPLIGSGLTKITTIKDLVETEKKFSTWFYDNKEALDCINDLVLNDLQLTSIPSEIFQLTNLSSLFLTNNQLSLIPAQIGSLKNLRKLDLSKNHFKSVPLELFQLSNLVCLNINVNKINSIPAEIGNLSNLNELNCGKNVITKIPKEIGNLINLEILSLPFNKITEVPKEISNLVNLEILFLQNNEIAEIPEEFVDLVNLEELTLQNNKIVKFPVELLMRDSLTIDLEGNLNQHS